MMQLVCINIVVFGLENYILGISLSNLFLMCFFCNFTSFV